MALATNFLSSSPSLSLVPHLSRPQRLNHRFVVSASLSNNSQYRVLRRRIVRKKERNSSFSWMATVGDKVEAMVPTSVPVRVAHELLQAGHRYLDVRTPEEFSAGHAVGAINIPYLYRVGSGMTKNADFVDEVLSHFRKDDEIIVGCQLGKRSLMAATDLLNAGFTGVTDISGGYVAWNQTGLPVES